MAEDTAGLVRNCANKTCPWSHLEVQSDSLTCYDGMIVGFCNPGCRDKFIEATCHFDTILRLKPNEIYPDTILNEICPWSQANISPDCLTKYMNHIVGFSTTEFRDKFAAAIATFESSR